MLHFIRYTCPAIMLPVIEGAFAANGYLVTTAVHTHPNRMTTVVLQRHATIVLLIGLSHYDTGAIAVWGADQRAATSLLESLPIVLDKQPAPKAQNQQLHYQPYDG